MSLSIVERYTAPLTLLFRCDAQPDSTLWDLWDGEVLRSAVIAPSSCPVALHHWCVGTLWLVQIITKDGILTQTARFQAHTDLGLDLPDPEIIRTAIQSHPFSVEPVDVS